MMYDWKNVFEFNDTFLNKSLGYLVTIVYFFIINAVSVVYDTAPNGMWELSEQALVTVLCSSACKLKAWMMSQRNKL